MNPQNFFRVNKLIFTALLIGMLLFLGVTLFLVDEELTLFFEADNPFFFVIPVVFISCLAISNFIPKKLLSQAKSQDDLAKKTTMYNSASIIRYALIECPVLFAIVGFHLTHSLFFIIIAVAAILYFVTLRPSEEKISRALELTYDEKAALGFK